MKALVGAFNQEKALVGAFSVIVQPVVEPTEHYTALDLVEHYDDEVCVGAAEHGDVHRHGRRVRLVQANTLVIEVSMGLREIS